MVVVLLKRACSTSHLTLAVRSSVVEPTDQEDDGAKTVPLERFNKLAQALISEQVGRSWVPCATAGSGFVMH